MSFDLEKFPTSESAQRMVGMVSPIYEKAYVGKWLYQVMGLEMDEARILVESLRDQCFLERCTWGMRYWEERYGITPDESKDIEERRRAVMIKSRKRGALSPAVFEEILEELTGRTIDIVEDNSHYTFSVSVGSGDSLIDYSAFISRINTVKPSHLAYTIHLPKKGTVTIFVASAIHESKRITITKWDRRGVSKMTWLADELWNTLKDENGNIFVD